MAATFSEPIVCPKLIGRDDALGRLTALFEPARTRGQLALLSGEAGIGKSRLAQAIGQHAGGLGWRVLQGRFFEGDSGSPFSAIGDLLRHWRAGEPELGLEVDASLTADLAPIEGDVGVTADPDLDKRRVLVALEALMAALAARRPTLVVVEDLHWADANSLEAIAHLAIARVPGLLLLLTYRSDEVEPGLRSLLATIDRERLGVEVSLGRLAVREVDEMIRIALRRSQSTRAEILHSIFNLTDGNPFFVEEVLRSLVDHAGGIEGLDRVAFGELEAPRSVSDAVSKRTGGLSETAREVLGVAAVAGVRFDFGLLREVSGLSESGLLAAIKELIAAQLVVEEDEERFAFRHALTREAVLSALLSRERHALSRRIAEAMEGLVDADVEDLARHFQDAGDWEKTLRYATLAGEHASAVYAPVPALEHFDRALGAAAQLPAVPTAPLYLKRGAAHEAVGNFDAARQDYEAAGERARASGDQRTQWQATLDLGLLWASRDYERAGEIIREAVTLARQLGDAAAEARSLNRLGNWYSNVGNFAEASRLSEAALASFRAAGDSAGVAQTLDLLGMTCYMGGEMVRGTAYFREAVPLLDSLGDRRTLASTLSSLSIGAGTYQTDMMPPALSFSDANAFLERGLAVARESGSRSAECYALWQGCCCRAAQGDYALALEYGQAALAVAREIRHVQWQAASLCALGALHADILDPSTARSHLEEAVEISRVVGSDIWLHQASGMLARALLLEGSAEAAAAFHTTVPHVPLDQLATFAHYQYHTAAAEIALASGDYEGALEIAEELEKRGRQSHPEGTATRAARQKGLALVGLGAVSKGLESLLRARAAAEAQGQLGLLWRIDVDLARAQLALGKREQGREAGARAQDLVKDLAAGLPPALATNFIERAGEMIPPVLRRRQTRGHVEAMTAREAEIAAMVARGLTNREIAAALVVSARTVETHVSNAMAKMGFSNRSQLAAWAVERGLVAP